MKKIILTLFAAALALCASAQPQWGIKGGLNLAKITNNDAADMKPSIYIGVSLEIPILEHLSIQPEALVSRQGWKNSAGNTTVWNRMNYLNIPVMAKYYVWNGLSIEAGPQLGVMLNAKEKKKVDGNVEKRDLDDFKNLDFSIGVGASYRVLSSLDVSFRYNIGVTKIIGGSDSKNSVIQLGVGYKF